MNEPFRIAEGEWNLFRIRKNQLIAGHDPVGRLFKQPFWIISARERRKISPHPGMSGAHRLIRGIALVDSASIKTQGQADLAQPGADFGIHPICW